MKRWSSLMAVLATATLVLAAGGTATAKVSGRNGRIVFVREVSDTDVLYTVEPDGTQTHVLGPGVIPHWSPDGTEIAYAGSGDGDGGTVAHILDVRTGRVRTLPTPDPSMFLICVIWSPSGTRLACGATNEDVDGDTARNGIYSVRASDGRGLRRITVNDGGDDIPGDYSPDGRSILFRRVDTHRPAGASTAMFVTTVDGTSVRRVTPWGLVGEVGGPVGSWSPDGTRLLFGSKEGLLFVVHPDGTGLTQIPLDPGGGRWYSYHPSWSPDGRQIVFGLYRSSVGRSDIYVAKSDGSHLVAVTDTPEDESFPDWGTALGD